MSEPIKVGDLVQVVKPWPCCGRSACVGQIFTVGWISGGLLRRHGEGCTLKDGVSAQDPRDGLWVLLEMLKRIPPLDDLKGCSEDARNGQNDKVRA